MPSHCGFDAPAEILQLALAAIEKKKQVAAQIATWAEELGRGECPAPVKDQLYKILFKPDKNSAEYKAVVDASRATHMPPLDLLQRRQASVPKVASAQATLSSHSEMVLIQ